MSEHNEQSADKYHGDDDAPSDSPYRLETRLIHAARPDPRFVSSPVYHASTVLFRDYADLKAREADRLNRQHPYYGRMGLPTTVSLEDALCELDDSVGAVLASSGVASIAAILSCFLAPGDHLLMVDSVYGPTRNFCLGTLAQRGIETTFYDPLIGEGIEALITERTRLIFMESPGSATFEIQDVPAICAVARSRNIVTAIDNTWATPLLFNPLDHGVDLAMQSGTKYLNGHADCLFGVTTTRDQGLYDRLRHYTLANGQHLATDDAMLAMRGLRTLPLRLAAHDRSARRVAEWLAAQERVTRLLHPAWPSCPGHDLFNRDFAGANGLFGLVLKVGDEGGLARFVDALDLFGIGFSWGGFESLCLPMHTSRSTASVPVEDDEALIRLHIGLEHVDDLIANLAAGLAKLDA